MSTHPPTRPYRLYSAKYFRSSPTYDTWVKITAADIHALRSEKEFGGQHLYFYLNHPIRYVSIVGVVVAIHDIHPRFTLLTIDDGSGANIELKIVRTPLTEQHSVDHPSNTEVNNVSVISQLGDFEVMVDNQPLDIGSTIKAKCTISEFRGIKQLEMKRVWNIKTTNGEAEAWAETAAFKLNVLSKPWHLSSAEARKIKHEQKVEKKKLQEYERRKSEYERKKDERRQAREAHNAERERRLEKRRQKEEIMMNAGAII